MGAEVEESALIDNFLPVVGSGKVVVWMLTERVRCTGVPGGADRCCDVWKIFAVITHVFNRSQRVFKRRLSNSTEVCSRLPETREPGKLLVMSLKALVDVDTNSTIYPSPTLPSYPVGAGIWMLPYRQHPPNNAELSP